MQFKEFSYRVEATITLSLDDVLRLSRIAEHHYDGTCAAMAKHGGEIYGWLNRFRLSDAEHIEVEITRRTCDLICKILEMESLHFANDTSLGADFYQLLRGMIAESKSVNARGKQAEKVPA